MQFNGEGIQHIALSTDNLVDTIDGLQLAGVPLMTAPMISTTMGWKLGCPAMASRSIS